MKKEYYAQHRTEILAKKRAYDVAHKDIISSKGRAYYLANRQRILDAVKQYAKAHREEGIARTRKWHKEHPERSSISKSKSCFKRRAIEYGTRVNPAGIYEWMREIRSKPFVRCHWCGTKVSGRKVHFDHIIALSKGGTHTIGNLCSACASCNSSKKNRLIADWICQNQRFLSL